MIKQIWHIKNIGPWVSSLSQQNKGFSFHISRPDLTLLSAQVVKLISLLFWQYNGNVKTENVTRVPSWPLHRCLAHIRPDMAGAQIRSQCLAEHLFVWNIIIIIRHFHLFVVSPLLIEWSDIQKSRHLMNQGGGHSFQYLQNQDEVFYAPTRDWQEIAKKELREIRAEPESRKLSAPRIHAQIKYITDRPTSRKV